MPSFVNHPLVNRRLMICLGSVLLSILASGLLLTQTDLSREAAFMAGIFVLAACLWVTEALPLFTTSIIVVGLEILLLANPGKWPGLGFEGSQSPSYRDILAILADPVLLLFFGGFVLAHAATSQGVDRAMSVLLLKPFGHHPRWTLLGLMLVTLTFSMWMSNTATAAMMLAIITPMLAGLGPKEPFRKAIVLAIPLAANIGGLGTPIASPPNAVAVGFLAAAGHPISFFKWMLVATPFSIALALLAWQLLYWFFPPSSADIKLAPVSEKLSPRGWFVVGTFTLTVMLWMTDTLHGMPASAVALLPVILLTIAGIFTRSHLMEIDWSVLILIGGGIALGAGMQLTGLDQHVVALLPNTSTGFVLFACLILTTVVVSTFMSNTAAANLFLPIGISMTTFSPTDGILLHPIIPPTLVAMGVAMAASLSMTLPISTPPNAMAYSRGEFTTWDLARVTLLITSVGVITILFLGWPVLRLWGVID